MDYRRLGRTGLKVSSLCMGTMTFGTNDWGVGSLQQPEVNEMVAACLDHGVNFFDTANVYSAGQSEEVLGRAIQGRRDRLIIATKVRGRMSEDVNDVGLSRRHILAEVEASLRRLGTDYIDLYQTHCWDALTPLEETLQTLDTLVRAGKVRYIGCSNYTAWQIERAHAISERHGWVRYETLQPWYSLVGRDIEPEIVPVVQDHGMGILPWSPLGGSFLAGRYRRGQPRPEDSRRADREKAFLPIDEEKGFDVVEKAPRDRRRPRRQPGPGGAELAARQAVRQLGDHRRPHDAAAARQPEERRLGADRRGSGGAGRGQRDPADLSGVVHQEQPHESVAARPGGLGRPARRLAGTVNLRRASGAGISARA